MRYRTNQKYSFSCTYMILIFILLCISADVVAQQEMTREERIKVLQLLKDNDMKKALSKVPQGTAMKILKD